MSIELGALPCKVIDDNRKSEIGHLPFTFSIKKNLCVYCIKSGLSESINRDVFGCYIFEESKMFP